MVHQQNIDAETNLGFSPEEAERLLRLGQNRGVRPAQTGTPSSFDTEAARAAGHSDTDIATFLARQRNFDIAAARTAGHNDANIIQFLTTGQSFVDIGQAGAAREGLKRGFGGMIAEAVGAPRTASEFLQGLLPEGSLGEEGSPIRRVTDIFLGQQPPSEAVMGRLEELGIGSTLRAEDLPPEKRPAFLGGEVLGGSIIPAGAPVALAKLGVVGRGFFKPILDLARTAPKRFLAAEAAAAGGAAASGAAAEFIDPGNSITRFVSEIAGGIFNPTAFLARTGSKTLDSVKTLFKTQFGSGREEKAAEVVGDIVAESGENPADIINLLQKGDIQGVKLTSGQKTGSPALLALESKLASQSSRFAGEAEDLADNSLKQLRELIDNFTKSGSPDALRTAARLQERFFEDLLDRRVRIAGQDALEARAAFGAETRADLAGVSTEAKTILREAMKDAREVETSLWQKIPRDTPLAPDGIITRFDDVKGRLLQEESLPPVAEQFVARMKKLKADNKPSNSGEIVTFRSRMLALARDAEGKGNLNEQSQFNQLAEGALDDLNNLPGTEADSARSFSRQLHEKFTNTFAGDVLATRGRGGQRIPAEMTLERAFGGGGTRGELQLGQLERAADFPARVFGEPMLDTQERFLRIAAQSSTDATTGQVNPGRLREFLSKNQATLDRFPDLKTKLATAADAEDAFRGVQEASKVATKAIQQRTAFANLLKTDDPVVAVGNALTGPNARRQFTQLAKLAKKSGQGSVDGLRSASIKNAFDKATGSTGQFSFQRLDQILRKGLSKEDLGLLPLMRQTGVIDKNAANRLQQLVRRGIEIENALGNQKKLDKLLENPDAFFDFVTRVVGAKIGAAGIAGGAAGTSLIAASAGSRFARNFAQKIPATRVTEVLEIAARDPKFMTMLLKKTKTIKAKAEVERQINAFLLSAGLQFANEREE